MRDLSYEYTFKVEDVYPDREKLEMALAKAEADGFEVVGFYPPSEGDFALVADGYLLSKVLHQWKLPRLVLKPRKRKRIVFTEVGRGSDVKKGYGYQFPECEAVHVASCDHSIEPNSIIFERKVEEI